VEQEQGCPIEWAAYLAAVGSELSDGLSVEVWDCGHAIDASSNRQLKDGWL
jgi:hypothetical protein